MESTHASEENNSKESSPVEIPETCVDSPTLEVSSNGVHENINANMEKSAQAATSGISNGLPVAADDSELSSHSEVLAESHPDVAEHDVESNSPTGAGPEMLSNSGPTEKSKHSVKGQADHSSSVHPVEVNHVEDKARFQRKIAVKPKVMEESEAKPESPYKGLIDTAAPFESVREAVTKFGGIVDWKAHKVQMMERRKFIQLELENAQKEIPKCKEELEAAEMAKSQVLDELETTKRIIEELKHELEKAQMEEVQAKQDSELAQLRVQEIERGVADDSSVIAKTQMEVAKERHEKSVAELKSVKEELRTLHEEYASLVNERDRAIKRAEEVLAAGKDIEKRVEGLTVELIAAKGSLELAHAAHHDAEERRIGAVLAKEQDCLAWDRELVQAQEELQQLNNKLLSQNDLKKNLEANLRKLHGLKSELADYVESILCKEALGVAKEHESEDARQISSSIKETLASTQKELEEVKANIENTKTEAKLLRVAATTLRSELDREKASLDSLQQREVMASIAVSSLEAELNRTQKEIESVRSKEEDAQEKMVELPKMLQQAAQEAEDAKDAAQAAEEELRKAKEDTEQTKAAATTTSSRLCAVLKEIEASKASERLALAAVRALNESKEASDVEDSPRGVTLPISEYYALGKKAQDAEELANEKVTEALAQVESVKGSELESLDRLTEATKEMDEKKRTLELALERAERANEGKLAAEQQLRKWRSDHEQRRKIQEAAKRAVNPVSSPFVDPYLKEQDSRLHMSGSSYEDHVPNRKLRKKKSFLPRMGSFLSRNTPAQT
ncbi:hypothetical protein TRIUR3_35071 [Triticum urartu]|uniref:Protein WEAK CHLOROPLAST MOVEMENT UNDER BLUE LIGHT 1 n=1 Tax=Triticum urartu TaxID=4572 RepID=M7Z6Y4_TRIUA|nr:protein WEAK CHLOROPLAST MOVEMENT UNDER BLUE LIGHT 1-like [Triticum urartu]XP_048555370.1 protein WEAK CHLOROPLAST MOVEMENT UNDER BLUE LIGHT 1-like [Triticum urartu]EMS48140.1 hypothetical protein TRIUR3_35071 [Triticum urartu]